MSYYIFILEYRQVRFAYQFDQKAIFDRRKTANTFTSMKEVRWSTNVAVKLKSML